MSDMPLAGTRVLVAEDELLVAMLIEDLLEDNGCHVIGPFGSLGDALAAADAATVDVAVLDVNLRGDKIYPVAERLASRGIPFFLLTGYGQDAIPAGHPDWQACAKPFKTEELIAMIAERVQKNGLLS
jgi:CheY-like chemotaxis protein